jgi:hypothetical protein
MSRGPGRIERAIRELFDAHPDEAFVTVELAEHCYPGVAIKKKHMVAVLRAAQNVLKDDPDWTVYVIMGMGGGYVFCNQASVPSSAMARALAPPWLHEGIIYRSPGRARRIPGRWTTRPGFRVKLPDPWREENRFVTTDRADWLARPRDVGIVANHVADHIAWRDGDETVRDALRAKQEATLAEGKRLADAALGRGNAFQADARIDLETLTDEAKRLLDEARRIYDQALAYRSHFAGLAALARRLITENDPDAIRAGLAEIASALDGGQ